jgi:hypothetical protein
MPQIITLIITQFVCYCIKDLQNILYKRPFTATFPTNNCNHVLIVWKGKIAHFIYSFQFDSSLFGVIFPNVFLCLLCPFFLLIIWKGKIACFLDFFFAVNKIEKK